LALSAGLTSHLLKLLRESIARSFVNFITALRLARRSGASAVRVFGDDERI
jgi:hypothetical protein